jgi:tetratricopeptide (TPR) repeat protein
MSPSCVIRADPTAQQSCEHLVDRANGYGLTTRQIDTGFAETRFQPVGGKSLPSLVKIGRDGKINGQEIYQKSVEVAERDVRFWKFLQGKMEIPWIADDLNPKTEEDAQLKSWIQAKVVSLRDELKMAGWKKAEKGFAYDVELGRRLFQALIRAQAEGGFGLQFESDRSKPPKTLRDIYRDRKAACLDFTVLLVMAGAMAGIPVVPIYSYQNEVGDIEDHLRIGFKNPQTGKIEKIADLETNYFGEPWAGEVWAPVPKLELLAYYYIAKALAETDQRKREAFLDFALKLAPHNYLALYNKGNVRLREKGYPEAVRYFQASIRANPNYPYAYKNLFHAADGMKDPVLTQWAARKLGEFPKKYWKDSE